MICPQKTIGLAIPEKNPNAYYRNEHISLQEMHPASMAAKGTFLDPGLLSTEQVLKMATVNGAAVQGRNDCGRIEEGWFHAIIFYPIWYIQRRVLISV